MLTFYLLKYQILAIMLLGAKTVQSPKIWLVRGLVKFVPAR